MGIVALALARVTNLTPSFEVQPLRTDRKRKSSKLLNLDDLLHSRGGTRTRDPGIMSAVSTVASILHWEL